MEWICTDDRGPNGASGRAVFDPPISATLIVTLYKVCPPPSCMALPYIASVSLMCDLLSHAVSYYVSECGMRLRIVLLQVIQTADLVTT